MKQLQNIRWGSMLLFFLVLKASLIGQVRIYPSVSDGFENRIIDYVNGLEVVDTHEHMMLPENLTDWTSLDFMLLFSSYSYDDMISAGLVADEYKKLLKDSLTVEQKWEVIEPWWEASKNTAYCRNSLLIAKELFGVSELNRETVLEVSNKISEAYKNPDHLYDVLDRAHISYVIQDGYWVPGGGPREFRDERFRYLARFEEFVTPWSRNSIRNVAEKYRTEINTLSDFEKALSDAFRAANEKGIVGVKTGVAYSREIRFEDVEREAAEEIFNNMMAGNQPYNVSVLQDYMMHRLISLAEMYDLPMVFHTGLHAGNGNVIENSKPTHLVNLLKQYPGVDFVFYHGAYPYGGELATIVKNFPNAWLDMSWLHIISPSYAIRYLHEWLETVPASKIMAFGGDGRNAEGTYGHLVFARQVVATVLVEKTKTGYFSEEEAKSIARMILHDNAVNFYKLR